MTTPLWARPGGAPAYDQSAEADAIKQVHPGTPMPDAPFEPREKPDPSEYKDLEDEAA